jgi:hypothetical protein
VLSDTTNFPGSSFSPARPRRPEAAQTLEARPLAPAGKARTAVRFREIGARDVHSIIDLLRRGFPERSREYWERGLQRQDAMDRPPDCPRYGYLMEADGLPVGAILILSSMRNITGEIRLQCNLSSWYVEPAFRCYASMLISAVTKNVLATYVNISPAPHTWAIIEAQGFKPYCNGQFFSLPLLSGRMPDVEICEGAACEAWYGSLPFCEEELLRFHAGLGCRSLIVTQRGSAHPFLFLPFSLKVGGLRLRCMHLVYCRDVAEFVHFAGPLGRFMLRRGAPVIAIDANRRLEGLPGIYRGKSRMYFKGPDRPLHGDLAYTERVLFGP